LPLKAFPPDGEFGRHNYVGEVVVTNDGVDQPVVTLAGRGEVPIAIVDPSSLTFDRTHVGRASEFQTVTIRNLGLVSLEELHIRIDGDFTFATSCSGGLGPSASCIVDVYFTPTVRGAATGTLVVESDSAEPVAPMALTGTGFGGPPAVGGGSPAGK
jgi:centrosomal CEP192-like protein